jgi:glycosyltransferase involved in cell wall biosynthesis
MKLIIISPFWNSEKLTEKCILSLKNQYYTNFTAYFIDDMSTDNSYEIAKKTIGDDDRFVLIKNSEKKYKTKNFIDVIRNNPKINWDDIIIELDGDDELSNNFVLGRLNKIYMDDNIWVCGSKWKDQKGIIGNYGKPNLKKVRKSSWNFSHLRTFRSFLFNLIDDEHLKYNGEYFKAACDLGHGIPILEMCGEEHFHYIDEPLYIYKWHDKQSYSSNTDFGNDKLQGRTAKHIYGLPTYPRITLELIDNRNTTQTLPIDDNKIDIFSVLPNDFNPQKEINYDIINKRVVKEIPSAIKIREIIQNKPKDRNELVKIKRGSLADLNLQFGNVRNKRKNKNSGIF